MNLYMMIPDEKKNLLLVDDTELFLAMEETFLTRSDFVLHTARSGLEAMEIAKKIRPDLVLLDLHMPDLSGDQVCARLKADPDLARVPVIIATSEKNPATLARCIEGGCDTFIYKPFSKEQLVRTVQELLVIAQRQYKRVPIEIDCVLKLDDEELDCTIRNLSEGGAFIEVGIPLEKETILDMEFALPEIDYTFRPQIIVRWASSFLRMTAQPGMGVEFLTTTEQEREIIRTVVEKKARKQMRKVIGYKDD
jgi:CheY-like chemotaxis protein